MRQKIKIVTDSTAYLPEWMAEKYDISVVSLTVNYQNRTFPEKDVSYYQWFFDRLRNTKDFPTTSQPPVGEFVGIYRALTEDGSKVISLHISGKLSGTVQSARTAASILGDRDITVVDTCFTVGALLVFVTRAAEMARQGAGKEEILAQIEFMKNHSQLFFMVDNLEYLHRGGRIGGAAAIFATLLQVKPLLYLKDGIIDVFSKVRTREKALSRMVEEIDNHCKGKDSGQLIITVMHVDNPLGAEYLNQTLLNQWPYIDHPIFLIGPVIGSHVGPGAMGISLTEIY